MNKNMKNLSLIARAKNSLVGRICRRVMGEETGAVMMEYVIVAVLIAAAAALAAYFFGKSNVNAFDEANQAVAGNLSHVEEMRDEHVNQSQRMTQQALEANKNHVTHNNEATGDIN